MRSAKIQGEGYPSSAEERVGRGQKIPLIRRYAPPSPARGEGKSENSAQKKTPAVAGVLSLALKHELAEVRILGQDPDFLTNKSRIDGHRLAGLVRRVEGTLFHEPFHHRLQTPRADVLD